MDLTGSVGRINTIDNECGYTTLPFLQPQGSDELLFWLPDPALLDLEILQVSPGESVYRYKMSRLVLVALNCIV